MTHNYERRQSSLSTAHSTVSLSQRLTVTDEGMYLRLNEDILKNNPIADRTETTFCHPLRNKDGILFCCRKNVSKASIKKTLSPWKPEMESMELCGKTHWTGSLNQVAKFYAELQNGHRTSKLHRLNPRLVSTETLFSIESANYPLHIRSYTYKIGKFRQAEKKFICLESLQWLDDDESGTRRFVRIVQSLHTEEFGTDVNKGRMCLFYFYQWDVEKPHVVEARHVVTMTPGYGHYAPWYELFMHRELNKGLCKFRTEMEKQELQNTAWVDTWISNDLRDHCSVCEGKFSFFFRKHHCRKCGEIICYKCSVLKHLQVCNTSVSVRMCTPCLSGLRSSNWAVFDDEKLSNRSGTNSAVSETQSNTLSDMSYLDSYRIATPRNVPHSPRMNLTYLKQQSSEICSIAEGSTAVEE